MITYGKDRTKHNMAAILAAQLLEHLVNDGIDTEVLSLLRRSSTMVENLHEMIRLLAKQCTTVYFFLDGLNEVKTAEEDPSEMRRVYLEFLSEGLHSTVYFLTSLTQDKSMDVRLWCSSQRSQPIVEWLERLGPTQISMNKSSVGLDVQSYLKSVQEGILDRLSEPHRTVAKKSLSAQAGTNFRWVFMMQASLDKITIPDLLLEKILQGLPERLETFYAERLQELRALDRQGSKDSNPNLSINILSLLAYSKRPLSVTEVQEALSIIEMPWDCGSLTKGRMIEREAIIHRCELFVDFIPFPSSPSDGYLKLSHGSVFKFLHGSPEGGQRQDKGQSDALDSSSRNDPVVKGSIIAKACLKYLSQDRYSVLLNKVSSTEFKTSAPPRQRVCDHKFLCYAAKHWFHHLQEVGHSLKRCANVAKFLLSPQFLVTLQVQSLFCPGHFIHPFHQYKGGRSTGNKIQVKRHLPSWFENCVERGNMVSDFDKFLAEWKNFLHLGETECLNGEIERCFWGALGPSSFMYKTGSMIERNKSVLLDAAPQIMGSARKNVSEGPWLYETISQDGTRVSTWQVCTRSDSSHPTLQLTRYKWCLDSHNPPTPYGEPETTLVDPSLVGWYLYDPLNTQTFPIIAESGDSLSRAVPIADSHHGLSVRIGGAHYRRSMGRWVQAGGTQKIEPEKPFKSRSQLYWEDIRVYGAYEVRSRRVAVETQVHLHETIESLKQEKHAHSLGENKADVYKTYDGSSESLNDDVDPEGDFTSAEEYWTYGSSSEGLPEEYEDVESSEADEGISDYSSASGMPGFQPYLGPGSTAFSEKDSPQRSRSSLDNSDDNRVSLESDADDEGGSDFEYNPESDEEADAYRIARGNEMMEVQCDLCMNTLRPNATIFYRCSLCSRRNFFDVCLACFRKGLWCMNKRHQLHKTTNQDGQLRILGSIRRDNTRMGIMIIVQRSNHGDRDELGKGGNGDEDSEEIVFRYTSSATDPRSLLHTSAPVMHPTMPLLVYALSGTKLLFANVEKNTYLVHRLPFDRAEKHRDEKCSAVSMQLRFSVCGRYLFVARVTAIPCTKLVRRTRPPMYSSVFPSQMMFKVRTTKNRVFIQVLAVRLSRRNPCSSMPKTLPGRNGISLEYRCRQTMTRQIRTKDPQAVVVILRTRFQMSFHPWRPRRFVFKVKTAEKAKSR
ncbi:uncharacterized protein BKA78DRAFT_167295 [Phyllosticta capitalensis]|uniref:uncharacterized protein n=1 Tax=Phyllosticta capitalensis TaxID=121624 RepID=UPI003131EAC7